MTKVAGKENRASTNRDRSGQFVNVRERRAGTTQRSDKVAEWVDLIDLPPSRTYKPIFIFQDLRRLAGRNWACRTGLLFL